MNRLSDEIALPIERDEELPDIGLGSDLMTLTKARLSFLVVITTFVGFCLASGPNLDWVRLTHAIIGTALAAAAAAVLNQWMEAHVDRLMERTRHRPIPGGRIKPGGALAFGLALALGGICWLLLTTNPVSAALATATILIYLFLYTPLKRRTAWCTVVGAVSGALPPVIGWTAATREPPIFGLGAWILFGILACWQMPHFLAIAWMYRDEYAQAGFIMLKRHDRRGVATGTISLIFTVALIAVTLVPYATGLNSGSYIVFALALDLALLIVAGHFFLVRSRLTARRLFLASILFLPLLLGALVLTKT